MERLRLFLRGKKTYLTAAIGVLGALIAWADQQIDTVSLLGSLWAAVAACCIRAGMARTVFGPPPAPVPAEPSMTDPEPTQAEPVANQPPGDQPVEPDEPPTKTPEQWE